MRLLGQAKGAALQQVFEGIKNKNGRRITGNQLTKEEKKRRVVLKRVNLDGSVLRSNFLKAGTMARVGLDPSCPHLASLATAGHTARCIHMVSKLQTESTHGYGKGRHEHGIIFQSRIGTSTLMPDILSCTSRS